MSERKLQIKLVAVADVHLKEGQEIDTTITLSEHGIATSEIAKGLVMMSCCLPDPNEPTGRGAALEKMVEK